LGGATKPVQKEFWLATNFGTPMRSSNWMGGVAHHFPKLHWTPTIPPSIYLGTWEEFAQLLVVWLRILEVVGSNFYKLNLLVGELSKALFSFDIGLLTLFEFQFGAWNLTTSQIQHFLPQPNVNQVA
jgi:hypothetical protein